MKFSQIFKSIFFVGSLTVLTKILGMIKEMIVASRFGISVELDEFYIALILPNFFINVFSNAVLPAFLPLVSKNCQKPKEQLGSFLTRTTFWVGGLYFGLWLVIFLGYLIWQKSQFFSNSFIGLMRVDYFLLMSPSIIFVAISQLWCAFLNSRKHFLFTSLRTSIVPLFTIVLLIFFPRLGFKSLVVGFLGGSFLELPFLWFSLNKNGFSFHRVRFIWDGFDSSLFKQLFYLIASASILNGTTIVDQTMAGWSGPCNLTALNYGLKLPAFCLGVFGLAAGTVLLPEFSDVYVKNDFQVFKNCVYRYCLFAILITIPVTIFLFCFSNEIVEIIFQRGNFVKSNTEVVGKIQGAYFFQIPFFTIGMILVRALTAMGDNRFLVIGSLISLASNVFLNFYFLKIFGITGIAWSTVSVYFISMFFLGFVFYSRKKTL